MARYPRLSIDYIIDHAIAWQRRPCNERYRPGRIKAFSAMLDAPDDVERTVSVHIDIMQWLEPKAARLLAYLSGPGGKSLSYGSDADCLRQSRLHHRGSGGIFLLTDDIGMFYCTQVHSVALDDEGKGSIARVAGYYLADIGGGQIDVINMKDQATFFLSDDRLSRIYPEFDAIRPVLLTLGLTAKEVAVYLEQCKLGAQHQGMHANLTLPELQLPV